MTRFLHDARSPVLHAFDDVFKTKFVKGEFTVAEFEEMARAKMEVDSLNSIYF